MVLKHASAPILGEVGRVDIADGGAYVEDVTAAFDGGGGAGAAGTVRLAYPPGGAADVGAVTAATITSPGSGYDDGTFTVLADGSSAIPARLRIRYAGGVLAEAVVERAGRGYGAVPTVNLPVSGAGSGAAVSLSLGVARVEGVDITNPGAGYTSPPNITFGGHNLSPAVGTVALRAQAAPANLLLVPADKTARVLSVYASSDGASDTEATLILSPAGDGADKRLTAQGQSARGGEQLLGGDLALVAGDTLKVAVAAGRAGQQFTAFYDETG